MKLKKISKRKAFRSRQLKNERKRLIKIDLVKHLIKKIDDPIALYQAQMIEQGLISKDYIESYYDKFQLDYQDVWNQLSFDQKSIFINREMKDLFSSLRYVQLETGTRIYLPFFSERFNRFYRDSIAVMDMPHFRKQFESFFQHCIKPISFGQIIYTGNFCQAKLFYSIHKQHYFLLDSLNHLIIEVNNSKNTDYYRIISKGNILYNEDVETHLINQIAKEIV